MSPLFSLRSITVFSVAAVSASSFGQLHIVPTFDSSVLSDSRSAEIQSAFTYAAHQFEAVFSDDVDVNINVVAASGTSILGQASVYLYGPYSYSQMKGLLSADSKTVDDATSLAAMGASDPTSGGSFVISRAQSKALGNTPGNAAGFDGIFTFGAGYSYAFDPNNLAQPGKFDFVGLAMHEISEVMGRVAGLNAPTFPYYLANDMMRYTAPGVRSLTRYETGAYLSVDGGVTHLVNFNSSGFADAQDYISSGPDSFNAFASTNVEAPLTTAGIKNMDVIGWDYNPVPEPGSMMMIGLGLAGLATRKRRKA